MDWKYKHFYQERVFPAPRELAFEAARTFMAETLGWQITNTADGFSAEGDSFSHHVIGNFRIQSAPTGQGTNVAVELLVERASWRGFMLIDVGGYYSIQIRKWLDGTGWMIQQKLTDGLDQTPNPLVLEANKPAAHIFNGCLVFIAVSFALYFLVTFVCALIGLLTGQLLLLGRGGDLVVHGIWARIISALILVFGAFLVWRIKKSKY
jgi:hypothetical protein